LSDQLRALRAQLLAALAQVDAMLGAEAPLPEAATAGPVCPKCGNAELERQAALTGPTYWVCPCGVVLEEEGKT